MVSFSNRGLLLRWWYVFLEIGTTSGNVLDCVVTVTFSAATFALAQAWLSTLGLWSCCSTDGLICAWDTARCWKQTISPRDERWILRIRWIKSSPRKTTRICFYRIQWRNTCRCFTQSTTGLDFPSRTATLSAASKRTGVGIQTFTHVNNTEFCQSRKGNVHVFFEFWWAGLSSCFSRFVLSAHCMCTMLCGDGMCA